MKKSILIVISLMAVFFFVSTTQLSAQWCANVTWDDDDCNCNIVTSKTLEYEIRKTSDNSLIAEGERDVTNATQPYEISGNEPIYTDTGYKVCARVSYYDGSLVDPACCTGFKCEPTDGQGLIDCDVTVPVPME